MSRDSDQSDEFRVVHVITSDAFAGVERHVLGLARDLQRLGCRAEIACPPSAERLREAARACQIPVHPSADTTRGWRSAFLRTLVARRPTALHVHDGRAAATWVPLGRVLGSLVIRTQHFARPASVERGRGLSTLSLMLHRALNRGLAGYIAVSAAVAQGARDRAETGIAAVTVIPPGIDLPADETVASAQARRAALDAPTIAYIGRIEPEKRLEVLLEAITAVLGRRPDSRFVIAGSGSAQDDLRALARRLEIDDAIEWSGWIDGPGPLLARAHVYVNTLAWEGFGMAMAEAMAFGLPVIAIDSGANRELVINGVTGITVPPDDPRALAGAIVELVSDRARCAAMGAAGRELAVAHYGIGGTAEKTFAFYRELLRERQQ